MQSVELAPVEDTCVKFQMFAHWVSKLYWLETRDPQHYKECVQTAPSVWDEYEEPALYRGEGDSLAPVPPLVHRQNAHLKLETSW